jgi:hypothetical protein
LRLDTTTLEEVRLSHVRSLRRGKPRRQQLLARAPALAPIGRHMTAARSRAHGWGFLDSANAYPRPVFARRPGPARVGGRDRAAGRELRSQCNGIYGRPFLRAQSAWACDTSGRKVAEDSWACGHSRWIRRERNTLSHRVLPRMGRVMTYCAPFVPTKASQFRTQNRDGTLTYRNSIHEPACVTVVGTSSRSMTWCQIGASCEGPLVDASGPLL